MVHRYDSGPHKQSTPENDKRKAAEEFRKQG
jgi:hypothetical protein